MAEELIVPEGWIVLTEDKNLIKKIEVEGTGEDTPPTGSKVDGRKMFNLFLLFFRFLFK